MLSQRLVRSARGSAGIREKDVTHAVCRIWPVAMIPGLLVKWACIGVIHTRLRTVTANSVD
jgi:hypothetical protein